eukprot:jgi/Picsp_1/6418/NSC_03766-R1_short-chain dehydrogenase reductase sdr
MEMENLNSSTRTINMNAPSSLAGKTYLITGSTDGIGLHTAQSLWALGAHVIIHGRNPSRLDRAKITLMDQKANCPQPAGQIHSIQADFARLAEVRRMSEEVREIVQGQKLTALINNAGVYSSTKQITRDGHELTWQTNVLAHYVLTALLWPLVSDRIINVASLSASHGIDFDNLEQEKTGYSGHSAYSNSKLCNIMLNQELHERIFQQQSAAGTNCNNDIETQSSPPPTVNCLDPGTVNTKMLLDGWGPIGIGVQDANDEFMLVASKRFEGISGKYFVGLKEYSVPAPARDPEARKRMFQILQGQSGLKI